LASIKNLVLSSYTVNQDNILVSNTLANETVTIKLLLIDNPTNDTVHLTLKISATPTPVIIRDVDIPPGETLEIETTLILDLNQSLVFRANKTGLSFYMTYIQSLKVSQICTTNYSNVNISHLGADNQTVMATNYQVNYESYGTGGPYSDRCYFMGGKIGTVLSQEIDGLDFITESLIDPWAHLSEPKMNCTGLFSSTTAYVCGGLAESTTITSIDKFVYENEVLYTGQLSLGEGPNNAGKHNMGSNSSSKISSPDGGAFLVGGDTTDVGQRITTIDRLDFHSEALDKEVANLTQPTESMASITSPSKGHHIGGYTTDVIRSLSSIDLATTTVSFTQDFLQERLENAAGNIQNQNAGYWAGGNYMNLNDDVWKMDYSNDSFQGTISHLHLPKMRMAGVYNMQICGYWACGTSGTTTYNILEKFDESSETCSPITATLKSAREGLCGVNPLDTTL